jgi:signal recognition particle receptor subunit beta
MRPLWKHYFSSVDGIVYVIDASDESKWAEARDELHKIIVDKEIEHIPILIFANKQDIAGNKDLSEFLGLGEVKRLIKV